MSKSIQFIVDVHTENDEYDLNHKDLKAIRGVFESLFPNDTIVVYYDDNIVGNPYHVYAEYKTFDHLSENLETHHLSKIIMLPNKFTMETVIEYMGLKDENRVVIKSISKL